MDDFPENISCILAEGIIDEIGNKKTLHGIFGGDEIILNDFEGGFPVGLKSLVIFTRFTGVKKEHDFQVELLDPSNKVIREKTITNAQPNKMGSINHYMILSPFVIDSFGTFTYQLTIDKDKKHIYKFRIDKAAL